MPSEAHERAGDGRAVRPRGVLGLHKVNNVLRGGQKRYRQFTSERAQLEPTAGW